MSEDIEALKKKLAEVEAERDMLWERIAGLAHLAREINDDITLFYDENGKVSPAL